MLFPCAPTLPANKCVSSPLYFSELCLEISTIYHRALCLEVLHPPTAELSVGILGWRYSCWLSALDGAWESSLQTVIADYFGSLVTPGRITLELVIVPAGKVKTKKQTKTECKWDLTSSVPFPHNIPLLRAMKLLLASLRLLSSSSPSSVTDVYARGWGAVDNVGLSIWKGKNF